MATATTLAPPPKRPKRWPFLAGGAAATALLALLLVRVGRSGPDVSHAAGTEVANVPERAGEVLAASALVTAVPPPVPAPSADTLLEGRSPPAPEVVAPLVKSHAVAPPPAAAAHVKKAPATPANAPKKSLYSRE
jgi:hypothetical protein